MADADELRAEANMLNAERKSKKFKRQREAVANRRRTNPECPHFFFPCDCPESGGQK